MLLLTRRRGESIQIGDDILVTFIRNNRGEAVIGITAPRDIPVYRSEIAARIKAEKAS
jgi:carbon storage regulator